MKQLIAAQMSQSSTEYNSGKPGSAPRVDARVTIVATAESLNCMKAEKPDMAWL